MEALIKKFMLNKCKCKHFVLHGKVTDPYQLMSGLMFCDIHGDQKWNPTFEMSNTTIEVTGDTAHIYFKPYEREFASEWMHARFDFDAWKIMYETAGSCNVSRYSILFSKDVAKEIVDYFQKYANGTISS